MAWGFLIFFNQEQTCGDQKWTQDFVTTESDWAFLAIACMEVVILVNTLSRGLDLFHSPLQNYFLLFFQLALSEVGWLLWMGSLAHWLLVGLGQYEVPVRAEWAGRKWDQCFYSLSSLLTQSLWVGFLCGRLQLLSGGLCHCLFRFKSGNSTLLCYLQSTGLSIARFTLNSPLLNSPPVESFSFQPGFWLIKVGRALTLSQELLSLDLLPAL